MRDDLGLFRLRCAEFRSEFRYNDRLGLPERGITQSIAPEHNGAVFRS
jgi:hypothetical protein